MKTQTTCHTVKTTPNIKTVKRNTDTVNTQIMIVHFPVLVQTLQ